MGDDRAAIQIGTVADWPAQGTSLSPAVPDKPEGYSLAVSTKAGNGGIEVHVRGTDPMGTYYGIQTLIQLFSRGTEGVTIRPAVVRDWPSFRFRMFKGQCWYYRDNLMFAEWAPRYKWNVFGSCYTDSPEWRTPPETYRKMIARLCDIARQRGNIRTMQLGNPYMLKDKAIRATAEGDVETLADFFEPSLAHGSDVLMLCLDDFAYLPDEDKSKFSSLAGANASIANRFAERIRAKHPGTRILLCPPPYWLNANRNKSYTWAHEYLRDFCGQIHKDIEIVWTGSEVTTVRQEVADIEAYQKLVGQDRRLFIWDNTLKMPPGWANVFRMNAMLETVKDLPGSAWPRLAEFVHGSAGINTYGPAEIYKVPLMTAADYLWNPEHYDPQDSLRRALYWFDEDRNVGPMVYRWINDQHQNLFTMRLAFLQNPSRKGLDEIRSLTIEYQALFDRIASRTANRTLVATLEPYRRRHVDALPALGEVWEAWQMRESSPTEVDHKLDEAARKLDLLARQLSKGDIDGDRHGCVKQELEEQSRKILAAQRDKITSRPAEPLACEIVSVKRIWDAAPHNAFTDLIRFHDRWYCTFREGEGHVGGNGKLRILESSDGDTWSSAALLAEENIDLRDPKLSITPDERLMMVAGGSIYEGKKLIGRQPRVAFSKDGHDWSPPRRVLSPGEWLWRVTWHDGRCYGVSYSMESTPQDEWRLTLWSSGNGIEYERITSLAVPGQPNETTLRFMPDGEMIALVRREGGNHRGWIGRSRKPYMDWTWHETSHRLGGPNFLRLPNGQMLAAGRSYGNEAKTVLATFGPTTYEPVLTLPSGGDCSYPGMAWHDGQLWMSYYSSHEGKSSIYLARIRIANH